MGLPSVIKSPWQANPPDLPTCTVRPKRDVPGVPRSPGLSLSLRGWQPLSYGIFLAISERTILIVLKVESAHLGRATANDPVRGVAHTPSSYRKEMSKRRPSLPDPPTRMRPRMRNSEPRFIAYFR